MSNLHFNKSRQIVIVLSGMICIIFFSAINWVNKISINTSVTLLSQKGSLSFFDNQTKELINIPIKNYKETDFDSLPLLFKEGLVFIKDRSFYSNKKSLSYLLYRIIYGISVKDGYSTYESDIVSNVVRNSYILKQQRYPSVFEQSILSCVFEQKYSKDDILECFINQIYFGNGVFGIGAASQYYFNKDVVDLEVNQIAFLLGVSIESYHFDMVNEERFLLNRNTALYRRNLILDLFYKYNIITAEQAETNKKKPLDDIKVELKDS